MSIGVKRRVFVVEKVVEIFVGRRSGGGKFLVGIVACTTRDGGRCALFVGPGRGCGTDNMERFRGRLTPTNGLRIVTNNLGVLFCKCHLSKAHIC